MPAGLTRDPQAEECATTVAGMAALLRGPVAATTDDPPLRSAIALRPPITPHGGTGWISLAGLQLGEGVGQPFNSVYSNAIHFRPYFRRDRVHRVIQRLHNVPHRLRVQAHQGVPAVCQALKVNRPRLHVGWAVPHNNGLARFIRNNINAGHPVFYSQLSRRVFRFHHSSLGLLSSSGCGPFSGPV